MITFEAVTILPIHSILSGLQEKFNVSNNLILQAEPGAGKSTILPLELLHADWLNSKKILMLEPRRVAAKSIAHYLAKQLGEKVGQQVGYQIKNDRKISADTKLEIVTEGILTRRLQNDPEIEEIGLIIFDEFHERSIHADLSLLLALEIQQAIRDDLKLLVMSATIDSQMMADYMDGAEVIECPGRAFPVSVEHFSATKEPLVRQVIKALRQVLNSDSSGDVLVFLPGQADIKRCVEEAKNSFSTYPSWLFLPLYGGLPLAQQEQALIPDPTGKRRVVFTTNIAETSLTIEGVTWVIDSGLEKLLSYDPTSGMTRLDTSYISKASAEQRKGRAGRTQAGQCIRLWDQHKHQSLRDYQEPEILSADLSGLILELCQWGSGDYEEINWLTPPSKAHFNSARDHLIALGLLDAKNNITKLGAKASSMGVQPRLAAMLLQAANQEEQHLACELAALLSDRDIFYRSQSVDLVDRLLAVQEYKQNRSAALKAYPIKRANMELLLASAKSLKKQLKLSPSNDSFPLSELQNLTGKLLLHAYPDRLAKARPNNPGRYQLANGRGVFLFDDDPLFGQDWLVVADCDAQKIEGRIFAASPISIEDVMDGISDQIIEDEQVQFDKNKQSIKAWKTIHFASIELSRKPINDIDTQLFQQCLKQAFQSEELRLLNWTNKCEDLLSRAQWLGNYIETFPKLSKEILIETLDDWLIPYLGDINSIKALKKIQVYDLLLSTLSWDEQQLLEKEAPPHYTTPSNKRVAISYGTQQDPTVSVQLQELFGEINTPTIAAGKVAIRFELLSPARRPIQTTSDLGNFWKTSYFDVAKDMKGRYPKHRWPDEPLKEKAGKSIKLKKFSHLNK